MRLYFFFGVAEIVVRNYRNYDPGFIASSYFEGFAIIVLFGWFAPAHSVTALAFGSLLPWG